MRSRSTWSTARWRAFTLLVQRDDGGEGADETGGEPAPGRADDELVEADDPSSTPWRLRVYPFHAFQAS